MRVDVGGEGGGGVNGGGEGGGGGVYYRRGWDVDGCVEVGISVVEWLDVGGVVEGWVVERRWWWRVRAVDMWV